MARYRWWALLAAATVALGCSDYTSSRQLQHWKDVEFVPYVQRPFGAIKTSAEPTVAMDVQLNAEGFIQLGMVYLRDKTILAEQTVRSQLAREASARGAERFRIEELNGDGKGKVTPYSITSCKTTSRDAEGRFYCITQTQFAPPQTEAIRVTRASLWRREPEQASQERPWWQLRAAVYANDDAAIQALIAQGCDPNMVAEGQLPVLIYALEGGSLSVVDALLRGGVILDRPYGDTGKTLLDEAVYYPALLKIMVAKADLDQRNGRDETPLMFAVQANQYESTVILLTAGAGANAANAEGKTSLFYATENGDSRLVKLLLQRGASPNATTKGGLTPLMVATRTASPEITRALLDAQARIDAATITGMTPLMYAASEGRLEQAELLLDRGANLFARNQEEGDLCCTALGTAQKRNRVAMVELLQKRGAAE